MMKKILTILTIFVCAVAIGLSVYNNQSTAEEPTLVSENIEVLARMHGGDGGPGDPLILLYCFRYDREPYGPREYVWTTMCDRCEDREVLNPWDRQFCTWVD